MSDLDKLFQNGNDVSSAADYKTKAQEMDGYISDAQSAFNDVAKKLGVTLKPLNLASLSG